jgi:hypothetical protein
MVMVSNDSVPEFWHWSGKMPGCVGHLYTPPDGTRGPYMFEMPFGVDNGAYAAREKNIHFPVDPWLRHLDGIAEQVSRGRTPPLWAAVADVVGDRDGTLAFWERFSGEVTSRGFRPAFVVQDEMTFDDVPTSDCMIFIGGTVAWKLKAIEPWCARFPGRVHVGKVNDGDRLRLCARAGAVSVDGTGWWHDTLKKGQRGKPQRQQLIEFWEEQWAASRTNPQGGMTRSAA